MVPENKNHRRRVISRTSTLPNQNEYTIALEKELSHVAFSEERAGQWKGLWQEKIFKTSQDIAEAPQTKRPLDLEIGTGNGTFLRPKRRGFPSAISSVLSLNISH